MSETEEEAKERRRKAWERRRRWLATPAGKAAYLRALSNWRKKSPTYQAKQKARLKVWLRSEAGRRCQERRNASRRAERQAVLQKLIARLTAKGKVVDVLVRRLERMQRLNDTK